MKFKSKRVIKQVNYIMDANAKRVSIVGNGANQYPATIFKADDFDNISEEVLKELEMSDYSEDVEVLRVEFPSEFSEDQIANYLAEKFEGEFAIEEKDGVTVAKSTTTVEKSDTRDLILTNNIKFVLTKGQIVDTIKSDKDKRFDLMENKEIEKVDNIEEAKEEVSQEVEKAEEGTSESVELTKEEQEALSKFDAFSAAISESTDIKEVLREANDGFIPGYDEIAFASTVAVRNATLKGEIAKIEEISTTTGKIIAAVAEIMKSENTDEVAEKVEEKSESEAEKVEDKEIEKSSEPSLEDKLEEFTKSLSESQEKLVNSVVEKFSTELKSVAQRLDALEVSDSGSRSDIQHDREEDTSEPEQSDFDGIGLIAGAIAGKKRR